VEGVWIIVLYLKTKEMFNMKENNNIKIWQRVSLITAIFTIVISSLLIANFIQFSSFDPVDSQIINELVQRLEENPQDEQLREGIRELDLLHRKAYFSNLWQVRTGGYILLLVVLVFIIAQRILRAQNKTPHTESSDNSDFLSRLHKNGKWLGAGAVVLAIFALSLAFMTSHDMRNQFNQAIADADKPVQVEEDAPEQITIEREPANAISNSNVEDQTQSPDSTIIEPVTEPLDSNKDEQGEMQIAQTQGQATVKEEDSNTELADSKESVKIVETEEVADNNAIDNSAENKKNTNTTSNYWKSIEKRFANFRGHMGNGIAWYKDVPTQWNGSSGEQLKWKTPIPVHGFSSPIIWDNYVFLTGADDNQRIVYAIDKNLGTLLWEQKIENIDGSPAKSPSVTPDTGHAAPTPATDGDKVYAIYSNGDIAALDFKGNIVWSRNLGVPTNHYGHSSSLMLYKDKVIVQFDHSGEAKVMALSTSDGSTIWSTKRDAKISWASPIIVNTGSRDEIILSSDPIVASYDPETGKELWQFDCIYGEVGPSLAYADGVVYANNEYATLVAIQLGEEPNTLWENDEYLSDVPSPIATEKLMLLVTSYGIVAMYDAKKGDMLWENEFDEGFYSSPILVNDLVYLIDKQGIMHIFKMAEQFEEIGKAPLGEASMCTPAFDEGIIIIRGEKNLYCFGS
jgi:outer membrane protein assembly factor BamB